MQDRHVDGWWTDFPDPPVQNAVDEWWFNFQNELLSNERVLLHEQCLKYRGLSSQSQVDLFVKPNIKLLSKEKHDWKDIRVIGELKESNRDKKATLRQTSRYVRVVFVASRPAGTSTL